MRGFGGGRRGGYGRGMGLGRANRAGLAPGGAYRQGLGRGNPYPYCRFYPWLPRRWWAMGVSPYGPSAGQWTISSPSPRPGPQSE